MVNINDKVKDITIDNAKEIILDVVNNNKEYFLKYYKEEEINYFLDNNSNIKNHALTIKEIPEFDANKNRIECRSWYISSLIKGFYTF